MRSGRLLVFAAMAATVAVVAGCGSVASRGQAASTVAQRLLAAVDRKDGAAACALLAPDTAAEVAQSAQKDCAEAILDQNLPPSGSVTGDDVYGQWARVRLSDVDVLTDPFTNGVPDFIGTLATGHDMSFEGVVDGLRSMSEGACDNWPSWVVSLAGRSAGVPGRGIARGPRRQLARPGCAAEPSAA